MLVAAALFAVLTWQVVARGPVRRWEGRADAAVLRVAARHPAARPVAQFLADLGGPLVALPVLAAAVAFAFLRERRRARPVVAAAAMGLTGALVTAVKAAVRRPAPGSTVLGGHSGYFPSGHAATAGVAYGLAVLALWPVLDATARRWLVAAAVPLELAVGAALVWRGYHWPSDVVASWCLCWVLLVSADAVTRWWGTRG